jgi:hypothetical protein
MAMRIRSLMLTCAVGCAAVGDAAEPVVATASQHSGIPFQCLNHTSIHVIVCSGSISLFPITVTVDELSILSDNQIEILSGDLNDLAIIDGGILDHTQILDDVEVTVLVAFGDKLHLTVTRDDVTVCTNVAGQQVCA